MFEQRDDHKVAIEKLTAKILDVGRDTTLGWEVIEALIDASRKQPVGAYRIASARRRVLREHGIAIRAIPGTGLKILKASDQVTVCGADRQKRMYRQAHRAIVEVGAADDAKLTVHHRQAKSALVKSLKEQRRTLRRGVNDLLSKPRGGNGVKRPV